MYSYIHVCIVVYPYVLLMGVNVYICLLTCRLRARKEDKLITPQKKTGPENPPLKAVIVLMAAAAAAALLSRPAKDLRAGSISLSLWKPRGRGVAHQLLWPAIKNCHKLLFICGFYCRGMLRSVAALMHPVFESGGPQAQALSCSPSSALYAAHQTLFRLIQFSSRAWGLETGVTCCHKCTLPHIHNYRRTRREKTLPVA